MLRKTWVENVVKSNRSITISIVLLLLGVSVCWFAIGRLSQVTSAPIRLDMLLSIDTVGCELLSSPISLTATDGGQTYVGTRFSDLPEGCAIRQISIITRSPVHEYAVAGSAFVQITGIQQNGREFLVSVNELLQLEIESSGVEFQLTDPIATGMRYSYTFLLETGLRRGALRVNLALPQRPRNYFNLGAYQVDSSMGTKSEPYSIGPMKVQLNLFGDEIITNMGEQAMDGSIRGNGMVRAALHSEDMTNRRETGSITYSSVLGIGIALLTEAYVILLTIVALRVWHH